MNNHNTETEATLVIRSDSPARVGRVGEDIARLRSVADFRLSEMPTLSINDTYFDTHSMALRAKKLGLRIREVNDSTLITLKGPKSPTDWGATARLEIEREWSSDALDEVLASLKSLGVDTSATSPNTDLTPKECIESLAMRVIQARESQRIVRNVIANDSESRQPIAELVVDKVTYRFGTETFVHREVEIESKGDAPSAILKSLVDTLIKTFAPNLHIWLHGKLAIGFALQTLLIRGEAKGLRRPNGDLHPDAYDKIDDYIKSELS